MGKQNKMHRTNIANTFFFLFIIISMNMIGFSNAKKLQKFLNTNKDWFNIVNVGDLCVGSPEKTGNVLNNLGGIIVNGHDVFGTEKNDDYSEIWTIKRLEKTDKVMLYNEMAKMCLSDEGKILINSQHKIRYCDKRNPNQLFEIKHMNFD